MYDIVIIGAGPAGLTAAIYGLRADKKVLVLEKESFGGQIAISPKIENYPGFLQMSGNEFTEKMLEQVTVHGGDIELDAATGIRREEDELVVVTERGEYETRTVIIAAGAKHRQLNVPGEAELAGDGVSYCAVCDGAFYAGKAVGVVGGGNSALQEAIQLSDRCSRVTVVQNLPYLTGEEKLQKILLSRKNVQVLYNTVVESVERSGALTVHLINTEENRSKSIHVEGLFVAIGQQPENEPFADVADLDRYGYLESDEDCMTKTPGVFVAGDCRTKNVRQITTAVSDGTVAALAAIRYIDNSR